MQLDRVEFVFVLRRDRESLGGCDGTHLYTEACYSPQGMGMGMGLGMCDMDMDMDMDVEVDMDMDMGMGMGMVMVMVMVMDMDMDMDMAMAMAMDAGMHMAAHHELEVPFEIMPHEADWQEVPSLRAFPVDPLEIKGDWLAVSIKLARGTNGGQGGGGVGGGGIGGGGAGGGGVGGGRSGGVAGGPPG
eukprot:4873409-Prymnesium_polylepis.1